MLMMSSESEPKREEVVVVGGGIIGLTTAYELSKHCSVHVVEKRSSVCQGASYQNGGVVNVESIAPVNSYMSLWATVKASALYMTTGQPTNSVIMPAALLEPNLLLWVKYFILNSSQERIQYHAEGMRQIGAAIAPLMEELFERTGFDKVSHNFHYTPGLLLSKVGDPAKYVAEKQALFDTVFPKHFVTGTELAKVKECSGIQGLESAGHNVGCVEPDNITVNTRKLGESLQAYLVEKGVQFTYGEDIKLVTRDNKVTHVESDDGTTVTGDKYVVCAGYDSNKLLQNIGLKIPLVPIKAYSLHIENPAVADRWRYAVHISAEVAGLFTPYREGLEQHSIRVTGIRDMEGRDPTLRPERVESLMQVARQFTGSDWKEENVKVWCGIMPLSPDDFPVIGQTKRFSNLYINTGHGFRGTAYSLPSARLLAQLMTQAGGKPTANTCFDKKFADPARFGM